MNFSSKFSNSLCFFKKKLENFQQPTRKKEKKKTNALWFKVTHQLFIIDQKKEEKNKVLFWKFSNCIISATKRPIDLF